MKKILLSLVTILVMTLAAPFTASAATSANFTAYQVAMMTYDDDGNELGWTDWVPCKYGINFNANNDIITVKLDRNYRLRVDDADEDWEIDDDGDVTYGFYCTEVSTGDDVTVTLQISPDNTVYVLVDTPETLIAFKVKNAGSLRGQKSSKRSGKKKSTSRHRRR